MYLRWHEMTAIGPAVSASPPPEPAMKPTPVADGVKRPLAVMAPIPPRTLHELMVIWSLGLPSASKVLEVNCKELSLQMVAESGAMTNRAGTPCRQVIMPVVSFMVLV
jgi:hypothetical protein